MKNIATGWRRMATLLAAAVLCAGTADAQFLAPPAGLKVEIVADNIPGTTILRYQAVLTWNESAGARAYNVYVKRFADSVPAFAKMATTQQTRLVFENELDIAGAGYAYYVTAAADSYESEPSNTVSTACGRPFNDGDLSRYDGSGVTEFVSDPPLKAQIGTEYRYDVNVIGETMESWRDAIRFRLQRAPDGMTIDERTGVVTWTPRQEGSFSIEVVASAADEPAEHRQMWTVETTSGAASVALAGNDRVVAYPNPATTMLTVRLPERLHDAKARIVDVTGALRSSATLGIIGGTANVDVRSLGTGLYFLQIETSSATLSIPFNVTR